MRDRLPLASAVWQVPHFSRVSASVTGIPSSVSVATDDPAAPDIDCPATALAVASVAQASNSRAP
jgi:hypothetical protein